MMKFSQYLELVNTSTAVVNYSFQNIGNLQQHQQLGDTEMKNPKTRAATPYNGTSASGVKNYTLQSPFPPIELDEQEKNMTLSQYLLRKAREWALQGKT